ncbi:Fic family protein [Bradyrhizobium sp. I1.8.5]|uniref:hypothetical protein n=1 Tax=Bradyrhizobium sp. I1.8.5 TaxID=3156365 RepID=UPI0033958587
MMMDKIQRAILENQVILAEALWMLLHSQGISSDATLQNVSARIKATRKLLEEHSEEPLARRRLITRRARQHVTATATGGLRHRQGPAEGRTARRQRRAIGRTPGGATAHRPSVDLGQRQRSFSAHAMFSRT